MNANLDPSKIVQLLTASTGQLDAKTISALNKARQKALERQEVRVPVFALDTGHNIYNLFTHSVRQWVVAGLLMAAFIAGAGYWNNLQDQQQIDEVDLAILTDDLPIEVFVD